VSDSKLLVSFLVARAPEPTRRFKWIQFRFRCVASRSYSTHLSTAGRYKSEPKDYERDEGIDPILP
jgi:hypothetical protein